ncbi:hypothetical protein N9878_01095 [bacterium]|nr:hypothetical protein [bacterium]
MSDLEMCKAIAKLEGVDASAFDGRLYINIKYYGYTETYNPITDLDLNCMLRDKWEVNITYHHNQVAIWIETTWITVEYKCKTEISRAVCECVLRAEGIYEEDEV